MKAKILSELCSSNFLISVVEQLPRRIQITFGGNPKNVTRLLKSLSFVTIVNPFDFAYSQTVVSTDLSWLISCKCLEPANLLVKWKASFGERFWSNSNFIRHKALFVPYLLHNLNKPEYLPFQGMENHRGFLQNSFPMPNNPTHRQQSSSFHECMVFHFFSRVQVLSFHLIAWQFFFHLYKQRYTI